MLSKTLFHYMPVCGQNNQTISIAYAFDTTRNVVKYNYCINHPKEQFSRKNGRKIANERFETSPIEVVVFEHERPLEKIVWHLSKEATSRVVRENSEWCLYDYKFLTKHKFLEKHGFFAGREIED